MSNGVYILKTTDGYRVNFSDRYYEFFDRFDDSIFDYIPNRKTIEEVFGFCEVIPDYESAMLKAKAISSMLTYETNDGIMSIMNYCNVSFEELINAQN